MAKLIYQFDSPFEYEVPKMKIKSALKKELTESFDIKSEENTTKMIEYLIDNFFWDFFYHFEDELQTIFVEDAKCDFIGG